MKLNEIYDELVSTAKKLGIKVRKESGKFKSGLCIVNDEDVIILNRSTTLESLNRALAQCISAREVDSVFIKPVIRDMIEREKSNQASIPKFELEVTY